MRPYQHPLSKATQWISSIWSRTRTTMSLRRGLRWQRESRSMKATCNTWRWQIKTKICGKVSSLNLMKLWQTSSAWAKMDSSRELPTSRWVKMSWALKMIRRVSHSTCTCSNRKLSNYPSNPKLDWKSISRRSNRLIVQKHWLKAHLRNSLTRI